MAQLQVYRETIGATTGSVQLYNFVGDAPIGSSVAVSSSGTWTVSSLTLNPGVKIYARASWPNGSLSSASSPELTIGSPTTNTATITSNPITEGDTSISGTGTPGDLITLYIGFAPSIDQTIYTTTVDGSGNWTLTGITNELTPGMELYVSPKSSGLCEGAQSNQMPVICKPLADRSIYASQPTICANTRGTVTVTNSEIGVFYTPVAENGAILGFTAEGTGSDLNLLTSALITNPTVVKVKAFKIPSNACDITLSGSVSFAVNPLPTITTGGVLSTCFSSIAQTASLAYSATVNSPTSYSIDWTTSGITDQGSTAFAFASGGGNLTGIIIPANTAVGAYVGTMTIRNDNGCSENTQSVSLTVNTVATIVHTSSTNPSTCNGTNGSIVISGFRK